MYEQVSKYLSNGQAVIYAAEIKPSRVVQQMSKIIDQRVPSGEEIERYIEDGALTVIDKDEIYSNTNQFDIDGLLQSWHSLVLKAKRKSRHKGLLTIGAVSAFLQTNNIDRLFEYENKIASQKIPKTIETICWYNEPDLFAKLRYSQVLSILKAHDATIHDGWSYRQWYADTIIGCVRDGIDKTLGNGSSNLILKTLKLVYNLDKEIIISRPELFEEKLIKMIGEDTTEYIFGIITDTIRKEMAFTRIAKAD